MLQTASRDKPSHIAERLEQAITQLRKAPNKNYRIDDLARQAALSPSRFIAQFKQITGMPPRHFLLDCRLEQAKHALTCTATPITKLALDLGFDSSQHFANTFKRATGFTPTQWRNHAAQ